jgi:hypothetical protein
MDLLNTDPNKRAAGFVATALSKSTVGERAELLTALMFHAAQGLRVIKGPAGAAEAAFQLADELVERA